MPVGVGGWGREASAYPILIKNRLISEPVKLDKKLI